jgi:hypothetical protein
MRNGKEVTTLNITDQSEVVITSHAKVRVHRAVATGGLNTIASSRVTSGWLKYWENAMHLIHFLYECKFVTLKDDIEYRSVTSSRSYEANVGLPTDRHHVLGPMFLRIRLIPLPHATQHALRPNLPSPALDLLQPRPQHLHQTNFMLFHKW